MIFLLSNKLNKKMKNRIYLQYQRFF